MGCCNNKNFPVKPTFPSGNAGPQKIIKNNPIKNTVSAAIKQPDAFKWFRDGITGIIKCFTETIYSDDDIKKNRDVCTNCEFSSKNSNNKLSTQSQCMRPDPLKNNAPCGCFIVCKTQSGKCDYWTHLSISAQKPIKSQTLQDGSLDVEL